MRSCVVGLLLAFIASIPVVAQTLDEQAKCAAQARSAFQQWESDGKKGPFAHFGTVISADYESHYNTRLKKCFVLINYLMNAANVKSTVALLMDAFERRQYAYYHSISNPDYGKASLMGCELTPTHNDKDKKSCADSGEFDALVSSYMEE